MSAYGIQSGRPRFQGAGYMIRGDHKGRDAKIAQLKAQHQGQPVYYGTMRHGDNQDQFLSLFLAGEDLVAAKDTEQEGMNEGLYSKIPEREKPKVAALEVLMKLWRKAMPSPVQETVDGETIQVTTLSS